MYYISFFLSALHFLQDEEINQQSQLAEKLKQQMLDQEEVSTGGPTCRGTQVLRTLLIFVVLEGWEDLTHKAVRTVKVDLYLTYSSPGVAIRIIIIDWC